MAANDERRHEREGMVRDQIEARGIHDPRVLDALRRVPRHLFTPPSSEAFANAYGDRAHPIGEGQTISQPYIVALMTEKLALRGNERVLEIGAGSGYQTAVLSLLAREVIAIERIEALAQRAQKALAAFGAANVRLHTGDGSHGWLSEAPYDAILVAAVAPDVPPALLAQLALGGRLILPIGPEGGVQRLYLYHKASDSAVTRDDLGEVAFVPLVGTYGYGLPADLGDVDF